LAGIDMVRGRGQLLPTHRRRRIEGRIARLRVGTACDEQDCRKQELEVPHDEAGLNTRSDEIGIVFYVLHNAPVIRAFLFDLDGTLVDSERETAEAMARALSRGHGIEIEPYDRDFIIGRSWVAIYDSLKARYPHLTWSREETIARTAELRDEVFAELGVTVLPGAREVLGWTRAHPRALVTGSSRREALQVLPLIGPEASFETILAAEDVPRSKPAPDGYQQAIAALGVRPEECLVIEDSVNGIAAGRAAGCLVLAIRAGNFGGWDQSGAHHILDTLEPLTPQLVDQLARDYGSGMRGQP
jgi:HAD superfamily hydrolase (TIGR01509 family)